MPKASWGKAMHTSLMLDAEHEFNASTFTTRVVAGTGSDMYSAICGGIGALRGPKHGGANEVAFEIQQRYDNPDEAEADIKARVEKKEDVIGFLLLDAQQGDQGSRARSVEGSRQHEDVRHRRASRDKSEEHTSELQSLMRISYAVFC